MKIKLENRVLTVVTDIPASVLKYKKPLEIKDKDGNVVYKVSVDSDKPYVSKFGITCNTVVDGFLALICTVGEFNQTPDEIKEQLKIESGEALVAVKAYTPAIAHEFEATAAVIDSIFDEDAE